MALEEKMAASAAARTNPKPVSQPHRLSLAERESVTISGVKDVLAFDVSEVLLETTEGMLSIKGSDLHVNRLTLEKGEVDVTGKIDSLTYSDAAGFKKPGESFLNRLFR